MNVVLGKATLSCPQNMSGCATTKELRETTNRIRRIRRWKNLTTLERKGLQEVIDKLHDQVKEDKDIEADLQEKLGVGKESY